MSDSTELGRRVAVVAGDLASAEAACRALGAGAEVVRLSDVDLAEHEAVVILGGPSPWARVRAWRIAGHRIGVVAAGASLAWPDPEERPSLEPLALVKGAPEGEVLREALERVSARPAAGLTLLRLGERAVDLLRRRVRSAEGEQPLTQREADLLAYLAARPGREVSREDLLRDVWGHKRVGPTRAVDMAVLRLRKKIELDPQDPAFLLACRGDGYRLVIQQPAPARGNLRSLHSRFFGRGALLAELQRALLEGERLLVLIGPPGVGKTRLSQELGQSARDLCPWPGGVWFCDLSAARSEADLCMAVAVCLGLDTGLAGGTGAVAARIGWDLRQRGQSLLVLDNAEQIVDRLPEVLPDWLFEAPGLHLLLTSQIRPGLDGERTWEVPPLERTAALALFLDRARSVRPGLAVPEALAPALGEALEVLDRLPLGIELAAARVRLLGLPELLARIGAELLSLPSSRRGEGARHGSLRAAIAWAWGLLGPQDQRTLTALAVFEGGFSLALAEQVLARVGVEGALERLASLVDHSLVKLLEPQEGEPPRYLILDSIRRFALETQPDTAARAAEALARVMAVAALPHRDEIGRVGAIDALAWLALEGANLRAAWRWALRHEDALLVELSLILDALLDARGTQDEREATLGPAVDAARRLGGGLLLARALMALGRAHQAGGRYREALRDYAEALQAIEGLDQPGLRSAIFTSRGNASRRLGDLRAALVDHQRALDMALQAGLEADAANARVECFYDQGYLGDGAGEDPSHELFMAIDVLEREGQLLAALTAAVLCATLMYNRGDMEGMARFHARSCQLQTLLPHRRLEAMVRFQEGMAALAAGRVDDALASIDRALEALAANGQRARYVSMQHYRGEVLLAAGRLEEAERVLVEERAYMIGVQDRRSEAHAVEGLARVALDRGDAARAASLALEAIQAEGDGGDAILAADLLACLGSARLLLGELDAAQEAFARAEALLDHVHAEVHALRLKARQAVLGWARGDAEAARAALLAFEALLPAARSASAEGLTELAQMLRQGPPFSRTALSRLRQPPQPEDVRLLARLCLAVPVSPPEG